MASESAPSVGHWAPFLEFHERREQHCNEEHADLRIVVTVIITTQCRVHNVYAQITGHMSKVR